MSNRFMPRSSAAGTATNPLHVVLDNPAAIMSNVQIGTFSADSLFNGTAVPQYVPPGGRATTSLTQLAAVMLSQPGFITGLDVSFTGDVGNVAGQTIAVKVQHSVDHGATWADVTGASTAAMATTAGAKFASVTLGSPIANVEGDLIQVILTPSAGLTAVVTKVAVGVKGTTN